MFEYGITPDNKTKKNTVDSFEIQKYHRITSDDIFEYNRVLLSSVGIFVLIHKFNTSSSDEDKINIREKIKTYLYYLEELYINENKDYYYSDVISSGINGEYKYINQNNNKLLLINQMIIDILYTYNVNKIPLIDNNSIAVHIVKDKNGM